MTLSLPSNDHNHCYLHTADEDMRLADETIPAQITSTGFNHLHCQKAAINTSNTGVEEAMNWSFAYTEDPDIIH